MQESPPPQDSAPKSRPPYLFLIPVALGIVGFIGYQTVKVGTTDTHVISRSPFAIDTSVAQAVVSHGVITVHAGKRPAPHPQRVADVQPTDTPESPTPAPTESPAPQPSVTASAPARETPSPKPAPTHAKKVVAKHARPAAKRPAQTNDGDDDQTIAQEPVPHIRPAAAKAAAARTIANINVTRDSPAQSSDGATTPPITDAPSVRKEPREVSEPPKTVVAEAEVPKPEVASTINAVDRVVEARMLYAAAPDYPEIARDQGVRGTSVVFVTVDPAGSIVHVSIASSSGNSVLDRSAISAARSSRYVPPKVDGKPAIETYRVTYDFAP